MTDTKKKKGCKNPIGICQLSFYYCKKCKFGIGTKKKECKHDWQVYCFGLFCKKCGKAKP